MPARKFRVRTPVQRARVLPAKIESDMNTLSVLERLATDPDQGAQARVAAARTLLEAQGAIGRHQTRPDAADLDTAVSALDRAGMVRELARLRARYVLA